MRLEYSFTREDSLLLARPYSAPERWDGRARLLTALAVMIFIFAALIGVGGDAGDVTAAALMAGVGALIVAATTARGAWRRRKSANDYKTSLEQMLENTHCREARFFEYDDEGFASGCNCSTLRQPWSRAMSFAENEEFFAITTPAGETILPKHAFPEAAMETEFRALVHEHLQLEPSFAEPGFTMQAQKQDRKAANRLHFLRGGGWRDHLERQWWRYLWFTGWGAWILVSSRRDGSTGLTLSVFMIVLSVIVLLNWLRTVGRRERDGAPLEVSLGAEGLRLKDWVTTSREPWSGYLGYLEDERMMLLYLAPRYYRMLPKRWMGPQQERLLAIVRERLPEYKRGAAQK